MITIDNKPNQRLTGNLFLADGSILQIAALDAESEQLIGRLISVMQLIPEVAHPVSETALTQHNLNIGPFSGTDPGKDISAGTDLEPPESPFFRRLQLKSDGEKNEGTVTTEQDGSLILTVSAVGSEETQIAYLMRLTILLALQAERGVLIHGALAEWQGKGVILTGPSGAGKSTASERLALPWRSLSDDATLVVAGRDGGYWAHPWPTWSNLLEGKTPISWNVLHAVPLSGIFFLAHAETNQVLPITGPQTIAYLTKAIDSISWPMELHMDSGAIHNLRRHHFQKACSLTVNVPCYQLFFNPQVAFWQHIEHVLNNTD